MATPLGTLDRLFLRLESPTTPMHVGGVLVFGGASGARPRLDVLRAAPVQASPFDWMLQGGGRPAWDRVVGVPAPVHHLRLDPPGDDAALMAAVSRLHGGRLDRDRLLWECHVIEGLSGDRFAIYYKMHHACIDGVTAIRRLEAALTSDPVRPTPPLWAVAPAPRPPRAPRPRPGIGAGLRTAAELGTWLARMARSARDRDPGRAASPYTAPRTPLNDLLGAARGVAWQRLPLDGVRAIATAVGVTINEVALALVGSILRDHLLARDALPDRPLVAMVPVSLRGAADDAGNHVGSILCKLGTEIEDPLQRLRAVASSSADGKRIIRAMSPAAAAAFSLAYTFPAVMAQLAGVARWSALPFNVVVSNVAGPREQLFEDGAPLEAIYPVSLLFERQALNVTLVSCRDHLDVGLLACTRSVGDVRGLATAMLDAYRDLAAAVGVA